MTKNELTNKMLTIRKKIIIYGELKAEESKDFALWEGTEETKHYAVNGANAAKDAVYVFAEIGRIMLGIINDIYGCNED